MLAYRLRQQSLLPENHNSFGSAASLSHTSLLGDRDATLDCMNGQKASTVMEVDDDQDDMTAPPILPPILPPTLPPFRRPSAGGLGIAVPPPSSSSKADDARSPILEVRDDPSNQAMEDSQTDGLMCTNIEADEGYCEEEDDFAWVDSVVSLTSPTATGGYQRRLGLEYRTSREAANRCKNAIHSVPRMRRREKKTRRRRLESMTTAGGSILTTQ